MTDTTTARPAPPAWLNIDIIPRELREEMNALAEKADWLDDVKAWGERAIALADEYQTILEDEVGPKPRSDEVCLHLEEASGYGEIHGVICDLIALVERFDRAGPKDPQLAAWRAQILDEETDR